MVMALALAELRRLGGVGRVLEMLRVGPAHGRDMAALVLANVTGNSGSSCAQLLALGDSGMATVVSCLKGARGQRGGRE